MATTSVDRNVISASFNALFDRFVYAFIDYAELMLLITSFV